MNLQDLLNDDDNNPNPNPEPIIPATPPALPTDNSGEGDDPEEPPLSPKPGEEGDEPPVDVDNPDDNPDGGEGGDDNQSADEFFTTLDAIHGVNINENIDYGDVDPMSAEGVYIRESYIKDLGATEFENHLKTSDPRSYAYFLHRKNGGNDDAFFETPSVVLPSLQDMKNDIDLQRKVYKQLLESRGNNEKQVSALLKMATEGGELLAESETAWQELKNRDDEMFQQAEIMNQQRIDKQNQDIQQMDGVINNMITKAENLNFIIPEAEKAGFSSKFKDLVHYENGEFYLLKPLNSQTLGKTLEAELFQYLNGDLTKLIERKAKTVSARRLITKAKTSTGGPPKGGDATKGFKTLGDIV